MKRTNNNFRKYLLFLSFELPTLIISCFCSCKLECLDFKLCRSFYCPVMLIRCVDNALIKLMPTLHYRGRERPQTASHSSGEKQKEISLGEQHRKISSGEQHRKIASGLKESSTGKYISSGEQHREISSGG